MSVTHITGLRVTACGRVIQRCAWCGEKLCDSQGVMMPLKPDGSPPEFATWPSDRLLRVTEGNPRSFVLLPESDELPTDSCFELVE